MFDRKIEFADAFCAAIKHSLNILNVCAFRVALFRVQLDLCVLELDDLRC